MGFCGVVLTLSTQIAQFLVLAPDRSIAEKQWETLTLWKTFAGTKYAKA
jgi:hypothetical protein